MKAVPHTVCSARLFLRALFLFLSEVHRGARRNSELPRVAHSPSPALLLALLVGGRLSHWRHHRQCLATLLESFLHNLGDLLVDLRYWNVVVLKLHVLVYGGRARPTILVRAVVTPFSYEDWASRALGLPMSPAS